MNKVTKDNSSNIINTDAIVNIISTDQFTNLSSEIQQSVINSINNDKSKEGGLMGKLFGTKKELASMNIAVIICIILFISGFFIDDLQYWDKIIPIVAATIGYIFGRGGKTD